MVAISREEIESLLSLYSTVKGGLARLLGAEFLEGRVEIYDVYLRSEDDVGVALYYNSLIHDGEEPLTEYVSYTDARVEADRVGFFKVTGEQLRYTIEEVPGYYRFRVSLDRPVRRGERLEIVSKGHMGGKVWLEAPHHRRLILRGGPTDFAGRRSVDKHGRFHATLWKMPRGTVLLRTYPQPWRIYAEGDRLNVLFVFYTYGTHLMYLEYELP